MLEKQGSYYIFKNKLCSLKCPEWADLCIRGLCPSIYMAAPDRFVDSFPFEVNALSGFLVLSFFFLFSMPFFEWPKWILGHVRRIAKEDQSLPFSFCCTVYAGRIAMAWLNSTGKGRVFKYRWTDPELPFFVCVFFFLVATRILGHFFLLAFPIWLTTNVMRLQSGIEVVRAIFMLLVTYMSHLIRHFLEGGNRFPWHFPVQTGKIQKVCWKEGAPFLRCPFNLKGNRLL